MLARIGPWPVVSHLVGYRDRLWFANSVKGVNHNSADVYSYDPASGEVRYERHLFSQDAGRPAVADGLLYWPFEDARFSTGFGHFLVTDGERWQLGTIPTARIFHTHAMAAMPQGLLAATSAWRAGLQLSNDGGRTWRQLYDHPTPEGRVTRIVELAIVGDQAFARLMGRGGQRLLRFDGEKVSDVAGWPHGPPIAALTVWQGRVYGAIREAEGTAIWRTDGRQTERLAAPRRDWPVQALVADADGLWALTANEVGGTVWQSPDGVDWQPQFRISGGKPLSLTVYRRGVYVGGAGDDGRGILWGSPGPTIAGDRAPPVWPPWSAPAKTDLDWVAVGRDLDRLLADPAAYADHARLLRTLVFDLAQAGPPRDFFASRLTAPMPSKGLSLIGGAVTVPAAELGRWLLLWGMAMSGHGRVPLTLIEEPWTTRANPSEKYFEAAPAAMWTAAMTGQNDRATIEALIARLGRAGDPLWLTGDVIGALSALTRRRFGYDIAAWRAWWELARRDWPD